MMANGTATILNNHQETYMPEVETIKEEENEDDLFANINNSVEHEKAPEDNTEYLHVVLAGDVDEVSKATLTDVFRLNKKMKLFLKYYKCAFLPYMSKGNEALKKQMLECVYSLHSEDGPDTSKYIPSKAQNIGDKLKGVIDWFEFKAQYAS